MGGALLQLVAYGAQDAYLTGNPEITFFKVVYRRHTNFSVESIEQTFDGAVGFQKKVTCTISRNGDLIGSTYLECNLSTQTIELYQGLHSNGYALIDKVELEIGGQMIDRHYGQWMNIWAELTHGSEKKNMLRNMINGQFIENLNNNTATPDGAAPYHSKVYIPLLFFFCTNPGLALPLIALQYHEVKLKFTWGKTVSGAEANVYCDYIYLDTDERRRFAQVSHEYLIEQLQRETFTSADGVECKLNFNHPCKELV